MALFILIRSSLCLAQTPNRSFESFSEVQTEVGKRVANGRINSNAVRLIYFVGRAMATAPLFYDDQQQHHPEVEGGDKMEKKLRCCLMFTIFHISAFPIYGNWDDW